MPSSAAKAFAVGAALFGGIQAGVTANRALVLMPAWQRLGVMPWANFTRAENHGVGAIFYPGIGLAAIVFPIALAIVFRRDKMQGKSPGLPVYLAAVSVIVWASITRAVLVPAMFRLQGLAGDATELERIFSLVARWSAVNDVLHLVTFGLNIWALIEIFSSANKERVLSSYATPA